MFEQLSKVVGNCTEIVVEFTGQVIFSGIELKLAPMPA